ncbi:hypothetical protein [Sphingobacterium athyrii]|uniref:Conjugal transfer protein TraD n=1 Tax=Sphingobacterium athyrii TaxID=2152717 RepID=A0A363NUL9_9SPHI|nr:hypothetical protein [Sphingobacterium athyrii]PUV24440.1 hypothetical protein DCO56_13930 [Sphingobacterium athyrii]
MDGLIQFVILICLLIIIVLLAVDKVKIVRAEKSQKTLSPDRLPEAIPDIMGKPISSANDHVPKQLINSKKMMLRMAGANARNIVPASIKEDYKDAMITENFGEEYVDEDHEGLTDDERFEQGVSLQELMKAGKLLQQEVVNEIQEKEAVEIMRKIQGTELYGLLENSIGDASKRIATLLDRDLNINESADYDPQDNFDKFDIENFI